jgi:hypothetical protein
MSSAKEQYTIMMAYVLAAGLYKAGRGAMESKKGWD